MRITLILDFLKICNSCCDLFIIFLKQESHEGAAKIQDPKQRKFADWEDFLQWKEEEESQQLSYFSEQFGKKEGRSYFYCQQDGPRRVEKVLSHEPPLSSEDEENLMGEPVTKVKRRKKSCNLKGRMKTGFVCIAMMKVLKSATGVEVDYFPTHNHELIAADLKHHPLSNATNTFINNLLSIGGSPRKILKTLQGDKFHRTKRSKELELSRNDFIEIKTLRERRRKMNCQQRLDSDDARATYMKVKLLEEEEYCPVLIYKPFGHEVLIGPDSSKVLNALDSDIFMLGIQTKEQAELMKETSKTILIVDATYDMDQYGCQLLNIVGVDELHRGYPLGHCISSNINEPTLKFFFEAIKEKSPDVNINCVITDDDPALINSMNSGFKELLRHILCDWHFKRTLQKNLHAKVRETDLEEIMFKELCVIIGLNTESEFNQAVEAFLKKYSRSPRTKAFVDYFKQECMPKKVKWARCFRRFPHGHVETTMFVEAFHNILKTVYLKRKPNKRIDTLLDLLLEVEKDYYRRRLTTICTVGPREQHMNELNARHLKGVNINLADVQQFDEDGSKYWEVKSQTHPNDLQYKVFRISSECTQTSMCFFQCNSSECHQNLCAHMYMCTCPDDFVLCKHIHRIHSAFGERTSIQMKIAENVEFYNEPVNNDTDTGALDVQQAAPAAQKHQRKEKEEQEMMALVSDLSDFIKNDSIKKVLYPHLKAVLNNALAQCRSVVHDAENNDTVALSQMTPSVTISSREKLKCQLRPFERKQKTKKELKRDLSIAPSLQEKIDIKRNLLAAVPLTPNFNVSPVRVMEACSTISHDEPPFDFAAVDPDVPYCVEVETTCPGKPAIKPRVQFLPRPIFVPGKPASKFVDKQTPIV